MNFEWNWQLFSRPDLAPLLRLTSETDCQQLLPLSFEVGLSVMVTSVPLLKQHQWRSIEAVLLASGSSAKVNLWCEIATAMFDLRKDVQDMLCHRSIQQAVKIAERILQGDDYPKQVAFVACLYHERQAHVKAQMLCTYLLQQYDIVAQQLSLIKDFLMALTPRQREVAMWVGRGYTNLEIAHVLHIKSETVAEYLTRVYADFADTLQIETDIHGLRYRLIYWLTRLFERHPELLI